MWEEYAGAGQPPHVVSVASALWDVARLWMHDRQQLEGPELSKQLLQGWVANLTAVVRYSQQQLPQVRHVWPLASCGGVSGLTRAAACGVGGVGGPVSRQPRRT
jgi:hypothetical protein